VSRNPIPELDRAAGIPLADQIARYYRSAIETGRLRVGDRLPAIREVAENAGVTRATVQEAYRRLGEDGFVQGTVGRGTTVVSRAEAAPGPLSACAEAAMRQVQESTGVPALPAGRAVVADFAQLAPDLARFPVDELRAAFDSVLSSRAGEVLGYAHEALGLPELRELLAQWSREGDPGAAAGDFLVTGGAQQALDLVLRTFCAPGDAVVVTSPSYHQMAGLLEAHGLAAVAVPWRQEGLDLEAFEQALRRPDVRLCYLMPTFHNPTGRTLGAQERQQVVEIVARTRVPVVEDEYQQQLRFRGEPLPSLRQLDPRRLTVTVATFSKGLVPGLRVGWVQAGPGLLAPMAAVKRFVDLETSPLVQAVLVEFARRGALERCLEAVRGDLRARHAALERVFARELPPGCSHASPDGGHLAWLELPAPGQGDRLAALAAERGVVVVPGRVFEAHGRPSRGVRLSLSRAPVPLVEAGAQVLAHCARTLLSPAASGSRPFL
jgi:2-aminoadipate transaminase